MRIGAAGDDAESLFRQSLRQDLCVGNDLSCILSELGFEGLAKRDRFGGNDVGSVTRAEGANAATEEQLRQVIRDAGFKPVQRDTLYRTMFLN